MAKFKKDIWQEARLKVNAKVVHKNLSMPETMFGNVVEIKEKTVLVNFNGTIKECLKKEITVLWN